MLQPEKFEATSANITDEQKAKLKSLFPEIIIEGGKIDFDRLKLTLGETVDAGKERYGMNWPGKADCFKTIQRPSIATLVPARDESMNFDTTENLIIEGDNLETLKLLQKAYLGQIKMIYIDPPYNTGNDFIYPDDFSESLETYLRYTGQVDEEGRKFSTNTDTDGRFHSKWMNMMYPRLFLARNLLHKDGVIFVSIDDAELKNLLTICQEIFGEENILPIMIRRAKIGGGSDNKHVAKEADYIIAAAKNVESLPKFFVPHTEKDLRRYSQQDNKGKFFWDTYSRSGLASEDPESDSLYYEVEFPDGTKRSERWRRSKDRLASDIKAGDAKYVQTASGWNIHFKQRLNEEGKRPRQILFDNMGNTEGGADIERVWPELDFSYPKPCSLISFLIEISGVTDGVIIDFFAGSGTTAQAVLELNLKDAGNRKFILVQLPEPTERKDFPTIADITKERVRRVIKKLNDQDDAKLKIGDGAKPDRGFKVFKLQSSNFKAWNAEQPKDDAELVKQLTLHVDHLVAGRSQEDVLYELLLKSGFPLDTKVEKIALAGKSVFSIADGAMMICLEKELTPEVIKAMAEKKPERVVCLDAGFADNDQLKTNAVQTMKSKGVTKFQTV